MRALGRLLGLALGALVGCDAPPRQDVVPPSACASPDLGPPPGALGPLVVDPASSAAEPASAVATGGLEVGAAPPASERLFVVRAPSGDAWLLGASRSRLWAATVDATGKPAVRWAADGEGAPVLAATGDAGDGFALWVARGRSREARTAPIVLQRLDLETGAARVAFRVETPRNDPAALGIDDVDGDGRADVAFAYFSTKHLVRARDALASGGVREADVGHTAATRLFADVDGDGRPDEVVGQIYDADPEAVGKLRVRVAGAWVDVPTSGGIRTAHAVRLDGRDALVVSDGWHKNYGKEARARLSLATWKDGAFAVEPMGASSRDTSFLELATLDSPAGPVVLARGDVTTHLFSRAAGAWSSREIPELAGSPSAVLQKGGGGAVVAYDARRPAAPIILSPAPAP